jgi:type II secretory pathway pseudopilin PulG
MRRNAFSLIELILALALTVVATTLIGYLMQLFSNNFTTRGEDIRRVALARSLLNMIADDLRSTVTRQPFDSSVLQQLFMGQGSSGMGGVDAAGLALLTGDAGGAAPTAGAASLPASAGATGPSGGSDPNVAANSGDLGPMSFVSSGTEPGLYGSQYELMIDISRLPRPDEYLAQQDALLAGGLVDLPGDIKSVTYYVQPPSSMGVSDQLTQVASTPTSDGYPGGLVRRRIDRNILAYAEEQGFSMQLMQTGDLIAPEVISLEFSYFDGVQWLNFWDSSQQSLPWLVEISLAMQSATGQQREEVPPGTDVSTMPYEEQKRLGIEIYRLTVAIPGAQLQATDTSMSDQAAGMQALGL